MNVVQLELLGFCLALEVILMHIGANPHVI